MNKITFFLSAIGLSLLLYSTGINAQGSYDYGDLLGKSIQFYEANTCGPKPSFSRIDWRGGCHLNDGGAVDLVGGWHDAGDHVKFNYPLASAVFTLAHAYLDYKPQFDATGNSQAVKNNLRQIADYMIKCHPSPNVYYIQIAKAKEVDHNLWQSPEDNTYFRDVYQVNNDKPGTDIACSTAASFAALSMVFKDETNFSNELLRHAEDIYKFGEDKRGFWSDHIPPADKITYEANGYEDDMAIGAIWLYKATGKQSYLDKAENLWSSISNGIGNYAPSFRDHQYMSAILLAEITGKSIYKDKIENAWLNTALTSLSDGGMWRFNTDSNSDFFRLPLAVTNGYAAYKYAEIVGENNANYKKYRDFAFKQITYALGSNPRNSSYVVGFGDNFPRVTHHRAAHNGNSANDTDLDQFIINGALVGGPDAFDNYRNSRPEAGQTESAVGANAFLVSMAAQMVKEKNATSTSNPPASTDGEIEIENDFTVLNDVGANNSVAVDTSNPQASNGKYVRLFDINDELSTSFDVDGAGDFQIDLRLRTGDDSSATFDNLAVSYEIRVDGNLESFIFVPGSESDLDGDTYWGELTKTLQLSEGRHTVRIKAKGNWLKADRLIFNRSSALTISDSIDEITAPATVTQGETANVNVKYSASTDRDIVVLLQRDGDPDFKIFQTVKTDVTNGSGTLNIGVPVPANLPIGPGLYQFQIFIAIDGSSWIDALSNKRKIDIDALPIASNNGNTITVRAKGVTGNEIFELLIDDGRFGDQKKVSTGYVNYVFENVPSGSKNIKVKYVNDTDAAGLDMQVDYIKIGNDILQAENQQINTAVYQDGSCGGSNSELMNCNGEIRFGNKMVGNGSTSLMAQISLIKSIDISREDIIYPNPTTDDKVYINGPQDYDFDIYDVSGNVVLSNISRSDTSKVEIGILSPGIYLVRILNNNTGISTVKKLVIN